MHTDSMSDAVREEGITVVYEPKEGPVIADILLVHGLQGHPYKTWACPRPKNRTSGQAGSSSNQHDDGSRLLKGWQKVLPRRTNSSSHEPPFPGDELPAEGLSREPESEADSSSIYWPRDLLPKDCPNARILVYGYDTRVTKYMAGATSKNTVFSHGKDLLFALSRERPIQRPLIVIAHSLGGIVTKEMLAGSSSSTEADTHDVVTSVAAITFLGTPHRGSPELAAMGELARSLVSALRMETTSAILDALGLKTSDLERAQDSFSSLWHKYDFRVKTFQEGMGLTGINLGVLGNKVVPNHSSLIGDHRERAETIHANHMNMCRFWGSEDPNYTRVAGEICSVYRLIAELSRRNHQRPQTLDQAPSLKRKREQSCSNSLKSITDPLIQSLWYTTMYSRRQDIDRPAEGTCGWLYDHNLYRDWLSRPSGENSHSLLRLKGKPGTGKSILMKEAFRRTLQTEEESDHFAAAFFFDGGGDPLDRSSVGMFRSLLYQLLPKLFRSRRASEPSIQGFLATTQQSGPTGTWTKLKLEETFRRALRLWQPKLVLFLDGLDACEDKEARELAFLLWDLTTKSKTHVNGWDLRVCISSRHFPTITIAECLDIVVDDHNHRDLAVYMDRRFQFGLAATEPHWERLKEKILERSAGVFLWVVLVVDEVIRQSDEGNDIGFLLNHVDILPAELEALYASTISAIPHDAKLLSLRLFAWAVLAQKPLRLHEWHHILAFIKEPTPPSLRVWRMSDTFTRNDDQLEKQIRNISRGLIEVKRPQVVGDIHGHDLELQSISMCAGAGSLNLEHGESRIVQVIHESVRGFFLDRAGFSNLNPPPEWDGHMFILETCLKYIRIQELDALVLARAMAALEDRPNDGALQAGAGAALIDLENHTGHGQSKQSSAHFRPEVIDRGAAEHDTEATSLNHKHLTSTNPQYPGTFDIRPVPAEASPFKSLRELSGPIIGTDVHLWLAGVLGADADAMDVDEPGPKSPTQLSAVEQTRVLEDHPALLSYVTSELFTHVRLAQKNGADPVLLIVRLNLWHRWVALREDIPHQVSIYDYAARLGLWAPPRTMVPNLGDLAKQMSGNPPSMPPSGPPNLRPIRHVTSSASRARLVLKIPDEEATSQTEDPANPSAYEREGSVASFGSAGSHMSHTMPSPLQPARRNSLSGREPMAHVHNPTFNGLGSNYAFPFGYPTPGRHISASPPPIGNYLKNQPASTTPGTGSSAYVCTHVGCLRSFGTFRMFLRHMKVQHLSTEIPIRSYRCKVDDPSTGKPCERVFSKVSKRDKHRRDFHIPEFTCELCPNGGRKFFFAMTLKYHYKRRHPEADLPGKKRPREERREGAGAETNVLGSDGPDQCFGGGSIS